MCAAFNGHIETVRFLIKKGADVNAERKDGWTALRHAKENGHKEIISILKEAMKKKR